MNSFINSIGTANPNYCITQEEALNFIYSSVDLKESEHRILKNIYKSSGIQKRYSVIEDFRNPIGNFKFFSNKKGVESFPGISDRMSLYEKEAIEISIQAINNCLKKVDPQSITHIITVSCTG